MSVRRVGWTWGRVAVFAGIVAVSGGCAAGGRDASGPEVGRGSSVTISSASPEASPSRSPQVGAAPIRPVAAYGLGPAAAEQFVRHYVELMNYASQTGDGGPLLAASDADCLGCKQYADIAVRINASNGGLKGDYRERVSDVSDLIHRSNGRLRGSAAVTVGRYTTKDSPTAAPVISKAARYTEQVVLSPSKGNWVMFEIELEDR
ncbi:DUF6318 family protein [Kribbella sp. CA-245084]|uniref:DUF6318 family protein n=1 Tax=Kribbella sp. CA-245084 TaxID=3239940 RepID=UPI003D8D756C